jgi:DNA-binding MarR family transcriptional regulator
MHDFKHVFHHHHLFHHYLHQIHHRHFSHYPGQEKVLLIIWREKKLPQNQLLSELDIKPSSLSELLSKMEKRKLILREKNPHDKRETIITLTARGQKIATKLNKFQSNFSQKFLDVLTQKEQEQLSAILEKLHHRHTQGKKLNFSLRGHHWEQSPHSQRSESKHDPK